MAILETGAAKLGKGWGFWRNELRVSTAGLGGGPIKDPQWTSSWRQGMRRHRQESLPLERFKLDVEPGWGQNLDRTGSVSWRRAGSSESSLALQTTLASMFVFSMTECSCVVLMKKSELRAH